MSSEFTRFVIFLDKIEGQAQTDEQVRGHIAYLRELEKEGRYEMGGPFADGQGGMVIIKAVSLEEAQQISQRDPFVRDGVRRCTVRAWNLSCEENNHMGRG